MGLFDGFSEVQYIAFGLVLIRMSAFMISWPIFGTANYPISIKILTALLLSFLLFPIIRIEDLNQDMIDQLLVILVVKESFVGLFLGFLTRLFFYAISICGEIISLSMGLSSVQLFNPASGTQSTIIEQFQIMLASLLFLAINGHHMFLEGINQSFIYIPIATTSLNFESLGGFSEIVQGIILAGIKMSAPVLVSVFFMNLAMGIAGRAVPQINVLITSLPVNILVGLFILLISLPMWLSSVREYFFDAAETVFQVMKTI